MTKEIGKIKARRMVEAGASYGYVPVHPEYARDYSFASELAANAKLDQFCSDNGFDRQQGSVRVVVIERKLALTIITDREGHCRMLRGMRPATTVYAVKA